MWIHLEDEEYEIIESLLESSGLKGLKALINLQFEQNSPINFKHTKKGALKAAHTYFSADDLKFDDYVKWDSDGNAEVLSWQKIPQSYIVNQDCGCKK